MIHKLHKIKKLIEDDKLKMTHQHKSQESINLFEMTSLCFLSLR